MIDLTINHNNVVSYNRDIAPDKYRYTCNCGNYTFDFMDVGSRGRNFIESYITGEPMGNGIVIHHIVDGIAAVEGHKC